MKAIEILEKRISELEARSAHQERTVQDLSDGISKQWEIIDNLTKLFNSFKEKIINLEELNQTNYTDKPPPHY
mgnify:CR=1 FL=1